MASKQDYKIVNDAIHGAIKFEKIYWDIIDTKQFQRLRNLHQMGSSYFVYPSATHTRFEHSIGVCHLAKKLAEKLQTQLEKDKIELEEKPIKITDYEVQCVAIAGLCHDLGHGPFSHVWQAYINENHDDTWKHEDQSVKIFETICTDKNIELSQLEIDLIKDFIQPKNHKSAAKIKVNDIETSVKETFKLKPFLWQIVNNEETKIDVDKWDYFERDCYYLGKGNSFDHGRLMEFVRVVKDEENEKLVLAYRDKESESIDNMFYMRWLFHHRYYQHPKVRVLDKMMIDAFKAAEFKEIFNVENYINGDYVDEYSVMAKMRDKNESKCILDRIITRNLYQVVLGASQTISTTDFKKDKKRIEKIERKIQEKTGCNDLYLDISEFNYGNGPKDPFALQKIHFYSKNNKLVKKKPELPKIRPAIFQEIKITCISKQEEKLDDEKIKIINDVFNAKMKKVLIN